MNKKKQHQLLGITIVLVIISVGLAFYRSNVLLLVKQRTQNEQMPIGQKIQLPNLLDIQSGKEFNWSTYDNKHKLIIFLSTCSTCTFDNMFSEIYEISEKFDLPIIGIGGAASPMALKKIFL
jgi:hypothetical protein